MLSQAKHILSTNMDTHGMREIRILQGSCLSSAVGPQQHMATPHSCCRYYLCGTHRCLT